MGNVVSSGARGAASYLQLQTSWRFSYMHTPEYTYIHTYSMYVCMYVNLHIYIYADILVLLIYILLLLSCLQIVGHILVFWISQRKLKFRIDPATVIMSGTYPPIMSPNTNLTSVDKFLWLYTLHC